ncbi:hypothetical protein ACE6H2_024285 [Prunus campanulata]
MCIDVCSSVCLYFITSTLSLSLGVGDGTSAPKQEEVKRLPGEKIKKKVRLLNFFFLRIFRLGIGFSVGEARSYY